MPAADCNEGWAGDSISSEGHGSITRLLPSGREGAGHAVRSQKRAVHEGVAVLWARWFL